MCSGHGNNTTNGTCFQNGTIATAPACINLLEAYEGLMVLLLIFYIVVIVLAILGNTLIIYIVYSNRAMRTSTNIFIVNMAVCDLGMPFLVLPKKISELFVGGEYTWLIPGTAGVVLCKLLPFLHDVFICCSIFSLLLVTYDRYCSVLFPHKKNLLSKKHVLILSVFSWILSIILCAILLKCFLVYYVDGKRMCNSFWYPQLYVAYYITTICLTIVLPIILITVAYSAIFYKLKKQGLTIGASLSDQQQQQQQLRQRKIVKMAFAIVCGFAVCWLPFAIMIFTRVALIFSSQGSFSPCWFIRGFSVSYHFLTPISVTNPAICFIFGTAFREELGKLLRRVFGCCFRRRAEEVDTAMSEIKS